MSMVVGPIIAAYGSPSIIFLLYSIVATIGAILSVFVLKYSFECKRREAVVVRNIFC